jgi:hypothetical protein
MLPLDMRVVESSVAWSPVIAILISVVFEVFQNVLPIEINFRFNLTLVIQHRFVMAFVCERLRPENLDFLIVVVCVCLLQYLHHMRIKINPLREHDGLTCHVSQQEVQRVETDVSKIIIACNTSLHVLIATFNFLGSGKLKVEVLLPRFIA